MKRSDDPAAEKIRVLVRVRGGPAQADVKLSPGNLVAVGNKEFGPFERVLGPTSDQSATFDAVFSGSLLADVHKGISCTVMAYGATGSGKTFTVFGDLTEDGLTGRASRGLFKEAGNSKVLASFVEVYNDKCYDLLAEDDETRELRDDGGEHKVVAITELRASSAEEALRIVQRGLARRRVAETKHNRASSRSHVIWTLRVQGQKSSASLRIVDLAGSERDAEMTKTAKKSHNKRSSVRQEGQTINQSLLVLGQCLRSLELGDEAAPFRSSVLTRLLKSALGGSARAVFLATLSADQPEASRATLTYATSASRIENKIVRNVAPLSSFASPTKQPLAERTNSGQKARSSLTNSGQKASSATRLKPKVAEAPVDVKARLAEANLRAAGEEIAALKGERVLLRNEVSLLKKENSALSDRLATWDAAYRRQLGDDSLRAPGSGNQTHDTRRDSIFDTPLEEEADQQEDGPKKNLISSFSSFFAGY